MPELLRSRPESHGPSPSPVHAFDLSTGTQQQSCGKLLSGHIHAQHSKICKAVAILGAVGAAAAVTPVAAAMAAATAAAVPATCCTAVLYSSNVRDGS
eukprot:362000-Chlamydomonas_euryale.AAC.2